MNQPPKRDDEKESKGPGPLKSTIDFDDEEPQDKTTNLLAIGMLAAIVIIGGILAYSMMNSGKSGEGEGHTASAEETPAEEPAPPDSAAMDSTAMAEQQKPPEPPKPEPKQPEPAATPAPEPTAFGVQVGSYLFEDKANEVLAALSASASVAGKVVPTSDGGFAVVLGPFDSRSAAEAKGTALLESGAVSESRVITFDK
jgi:hypothetical protein